MKSAKQSTLAEAAKQRRQDLQRQERAHEAAMRASAKPMGRAVPPRAGSSRSPQSPSSGSVGFSDDDLAALEALEALLEKEDLLEYLEELVEQGVAKPEDLAHFEEADIKGMATKLVHRRKFLALRKHYAEAQRGTKKKGLFGGSWGRKGLIL
jgi:predicted flap endonuclease-1-like 5' DNA nuclease